MRKVIHAARLFSFNQTGWWRLLPLLLLIVSGVGWLVIASTDSSQRNVPQPIVTSESVLDSPSTIRMDSAAFVYSNGWQVGERGADPQEPADPWQEPSGTFTFRYRGSELALQLAVGNYWGYLYVTVDGQPANQLATIRGNHNSQGDLAGYRTFYVPEAQTAEGPTPQWTLVHRAADPTTVHTVQVEVWRSWGQWPIRAVGVDSLSTTRIPLWPGIMLVLLATWGITVIGCRVLPQWIATQWADRLAAHRPWRVAVDSFLRPQHLASGAAWVALLGTILMGFAIWRSVWPLTWLGLAVLGWAGLQRPVLWIGALLVGLPFYFSNSLPILPGHAIGLIDVGVLGGFAIGIGHWFLGRLATQVTASAGGSKSPRGLRTLMLLILLVAGWSLLATFEAAQQSVALREWRTVFLYGALFALTLQLTLFPSAITPAQHHQDQRFLLRCWLLGATVVAVVGLWQYLGDVRLIEAEGVHRVRAFYGSPNNLALYLERTFALTLTLALFTRSAQLHRGWFCVALLQGTALVLTFSKGALLLALPVTFGVLWLGGLLLLRRRGEPLRMLWWLIAIAAGVGIALLPFMATDRFRQLLNFEQGTGFVRLQLWQSSWQMALDHPWFGVGPDNFLYAYRSIYILPAAWQEPNLNHPHNWLLDWWTRLGLPGLLLAITWFGWLAWQQWQQVRDSHSREQTVWALGLLAAITAALAHGLIDASYALPDLMLVWVLMGFFATEP